LDGKGFAGVLELQDSPARCHVLAQVACLPQE
jgi:hypothetical protein